MKAGVDDTGSGDFKGFSCILFTDDGAEFLEKRGREILSNPSSTVGKFGAL
jgi:hypothetical protein